MYLRVGGTYKDFYHVDLLQGSALDGDRCTAGFEEHSNFADESICLFDYNVPNDVQFS
jgi:hypothetical protein